MFEFRLFNNNFFKTRCYFYINYFIINRERKKERKKERKSRKKERKKERNKQRNKEETKKETKKQKKETKKQRNKETKSKRVSLEERHHVLCSVLVYIIQGSH